MKATDLLKNDHREAMNLVERLETAGKPNGTGDPRMESFYQLKDALTLHTWIEEETLYLALENFDETRDLINEAYKEHERVDEILADMDTRTGDWEDNLSELKKDLQHHIREEEDEMFPKAERLLGDGLLNDIGRQMESMKQRRSTTT